VKAFLMHKDRDFNPQGQITWQEQALIQDLELNTLFQAMAQEDKFLFEVAQKAVLSSLTDTEEILYRQTILLDCQRNPSVIRDIYSIAVEAIEKEKKHYFGVFDRYPSGILRRSLKVMQMFMEMLKKLRSIADEQARFESEGFRAFFAMLQQELSDEFFLSAENHLKQMDFDGILMSAQLGKGNKGALYILHHTEERKISWWERLERIFFDQSPEWTYFISDRDESGTRAVSQLKDRGLNLVANALAQSADHILSFFSMLRMELAFYIGCLNLQERLSHKKQPFCFPAPVAAGERLHSFRGLYDVCLALSLEGDIVGNDLNLDSKDLVLITGGNQGGKSTFLRSIGLAQLMMQCGMFVPAEAFSANLSLGIYTHFKREEDVTMTSGKFDEELSRMNDIAGKITADSLLLFNESFSATNEREGSEVARQITCALTEKGIKVFFVTHLYEFADRMYREKRENAIFLRAERQTGGVRTFKMIVGEPLQTSFGEDLYNRIFLS